MGTWGALSTTLHLETAEDKEEEYQGNGGGWGAWMLEQRDKVQPHGAQRDPPVIQRMEQRTVLPKTGTPTCLEAACSVGHCFPLLPDT